MKDQLRLQAARMVIGTLDADRIKAIIESAVDAGLYEESFLPALVERHPRLDDVVPAFDAVLAHHGIDVPDKDTAIWQLIEHHLRELVAAPADALVQFGRFMDEVYWHCHDEMPAKKYVGDSHRIESLLSLYWSAGDLRDRQVVTVNGHDGPQAWAEIDRLIVAQAERWLADFDNDPPCRARSGI